MDTAQTNGNVSNGAPAQSQGAGAQSGNTPSEGGAQRPISAIPGLLAEYVADQRQRAGLDKAYWDKNHPGHEQAVQAVNHMFAAKVEAEGGGEPVSTAPADGFASLAIDGLSNEDHAVATQVARSDGFSAGDVRDFVSNARAAVRTMGTGGDAESYNAALEQAWGRDFPYRIAQVREFVKAHPGLEGWIKASRAWFNPAVASSIWTHIARSTDTEGQIKALRKEYGEAKAAHDLIRAESIQQQITALYSRMFPSR